jgi:hypothetical protein
VNADGSCAASLTHERGSRSSVENESDMRIRYFLFAIVLSVLVIVITVVVGRTTATIGAARHAFVYINDQSKYATFASSFPGFFSTTILVDLRDAVEPSIAAIAAQRDQPERLSAVSRFEYFVHKDLGAYERPQIYTMVGLPFRCVVFYQGLDKVNRIFVYSFGLLANLIIVIGTTLFMMVLFRHVKTRYRKLRGLCVHCGYPSSPDSVCPECGATSQTN